MTSPQPTSDTREDEPYLIAMDCFHAGSMGQAGKTIHSGTVEEWTKRIEAYANNLAERRVVEARIEQTKTFTADLYELADGNPTYGIWELHDKYAEELSKLKSKENKT